MKQLLIAAVALALVACASTTDTSPRASSNAPPDKAYRTGSNIPVK